MITWRNGTVSGTRREWPGAVERDVSVDGAPDEGGQVRALAYPALTGRPRPGDRVLVNTTALDLGLGTGGYALVVALPDRLPERRVGAAARATAGQRHWRKRGQADRSRTRGVALCQRGRRGPPLQFTEGRRGSAGRSGRLGELGNVTPGRLVASPRTARTGAIPRARCTRACRAVATAPSWRTAPAGLPA